MGQFSKSRSVAEVLNIGLARADSSLYWDQEASFLNPQATWRTAPHPRYRPSIIDNFVGAALDTAKWNVQDTSSAGAPSNAIMDALDGVLRLTLASTNEAEVYGINFGDRLEFYPSDLVMRGAFTVSGTLAAEERVVVGLCSAHNDTFNDMVANAWLRMDGSNALTVESDDGTTDNDDVSTSITVVAGQMVYFRIEISSTQNVYFFAGTGSTSTPVRVASGTTFTIGARAVQPCALIQKDSGTTTTSLRLDFLEVWGKR